MTRRKEYSLSEGKGPSLWRTVEDAVADSEALAKEAESEMPGGFVKDQLIEPAMMVSRRKFVQGSSIAAMAAGLQGCIRRPEDKIVPYNKAPEQILPGTPAHFATVTARGRDALGVLITSHDGRPTKAEGLAVHPSSLGASDVQAQAYIWNLYDPDRSKGPAKGTGGALAESSMSDFDAAFDALVKAHEADGGAGLRILSETNNSPSVYRMRKDIKKRFPKATFHNYSSVNEDNVREGARIAFGRTATPVYNFMEARVVVSLGADIFGTDSGAVRNSLTYGIVRSPKSPNANMPRLYVVESGHSITGAAADHRLRLADQDISAYAKALAAALGVPGVKAEKVDGVPDEWIREVVADLRAASSHPSPASPNRKASSIIVAGRGQPPHVHALAFAMNDALQNYGSTIQFGPEVDPDESTSVASIGDLAANIGSTKTLLILGGNPVYDAPTDVKFGELLSREGLTSIHLSTHRDETSLRSSWHVPMTHELEAWGDQLSADGTYSVQQPLIAPLFGGRSALELLAKLAGSDKSAYEIAQETARTSLKTDRPFAEWWRVALHTGVAKLGSVTSSGPLNTAAVAAAANGASQPAPVGKDNIELRFVPDSALWDGRSANNLWSLELPDPMTKIVWDNAALMSRATRDALGLKDEQMIRITRGDQSVDVAVWSVPGHADWSVTLALGWGRTAAGRYGNGQGFDVQPLRTSDAFYFGAGATVQALGNSYNIVQTQTHGRMEGRPIAIDATLDEYKKEPEFASYRSVQLTTPPLWKEVDYSEGNQWGMTIDLSSCTGCNVCVIACQSENNIPSVGKHEVERGREMHWIRIDRYFVGDVDDANPQVALQPVACQQCEEAPCENVCPVNATVHSSEGLNDMAYNRCIGTRYCANNCPYKVRRFNYLDWHGYLDDRWKFYGDFPEERKLHMNPNVTVRMRGVMEKCTYCTQRIQAGKIQAKNQGRRPIRDGEIKTACEQACPTKAITFGNLNDPNSRVARLSKLDRQYKLLAEIGTQPRTTYLANIRNPNPKMGGHS